MKTLLLSLFLTANIIAVQSQSTLYGIQYDTSLSSNYFVKIDPTNAIITQVSNLPGVENISTDNTALNSTDEYYVFIDVDTNTLIKSIYTLDINTGTILSNSTLSSFVNELNYDKVSGNYFALEFEDTLTTSVPGGLSNMEGVAYNMPLPGFQYYVNGDHSSEIYTGSTILISGSYNGVNDGQKLITNTIFSGGKTYFQWSGITTEFNMPYGNATAKIGTGIYHLVSVNANTGIVTRIQSIPGPIEVSSNNSSYNSSTQQFVFIADNLIYSIDVNTGNILSSPALSSSINELQLNEKTGTYYAIDEITPEEANYTIPNTYFLVTINISTGLVSQIDSISGLNNIRIGTSTIDTLNNVLNIEDENDNLLAINLIDASVLSNQQLSASVNHLAINITIIAGKQPLTTKKESADSSFRLKGNQDDFFDVSMNQIKAYPNPATNYLIIEVSNIPTSLNVYDYRGVLVKSEVIENELTKIDVSEFENGLYFFTLSNSRSTETKKIIVK